jgi:D-3-phosphoglycerate dehydrogenase
MLVVRNDDRPGVIGRVGTILGDAGVNIANMAVGQSAAGASALMVFSTTEPTGDDLRQALAAAEGVMSVHIVSRSS